MKKLFLTTTLLLGLAAVAMPTANNSIVENLTLSEIATDTDVLCTLVKQGNFEAVKKMLEAGVDINKRSKGMTPLMYAARQNRVEIAKLLITHGAKLKVKSERGYTALEYAEMSKAHDAYKLISEEQLKRFGV